MPTIGLVANVYNEINALPGWLECHLPFFDDVRVLHAGPGGAHSTDGTIELLKKWNVPVEFCAIDDGFGVVRTMALRMCPCEYVMLLDADERFYPLHRTLNCWGEDTPQEEADRILRLYDHRGTNLPNWNEVDKLGANLHVEASGPYDQGGRLRELLCGSKYDAVATVRRHWHDLSLRRPTQNWQRNPDWQLRLVRKDVGIYFAQDTKMHERLEGAQRVYRADLLYGPFFDHHHFHFKRMEPEQRRHDIAIYDAINEGKKPPEELWR